MGEFVSWRPECPFPKGSYGISFYFSMLGGGGMVREQAVVPLRACVLLLF